MPRFIQSLKYTVATTARMTIGTPMTIESTVVRVEASASVLMLPHPGQGSASQDPARCPLIELRKAWVGSRAEVGPATLEW